MPPSKPKISLASEAVKEKFVSGMQALGLKEREHEVSEQAKRRGLPYIDLRSFPVSQETLSLIPEEEARRLQLVPILHQGTEVRVGTCNPDLPELGDYLQMITRRTPGANFVLYLISPHSLETVLNLYARLPRVRAVTAGLSLSEAELKRYQGAMKNFKEVSAKLQDASLTELVAIIVSGGLELRASDIHIEAEEQTIKVRFRIDGLLYTVAELPHELWGQVISRLKLLAKLKLNVLSQPQDGRFTITFSGDTVDVRVSTIPTSYGESVVMRLLRSSATGLEFDELGLRGQAYEDLAREAERPNGMIMATGPTGSGKTTTLYAILNKLNSTETKIITLEDPIEYKLKGVNQSQIDHNAGYDFAKGLRAILRQDPDIVMVGEIRDLETADIAVNAALTGHLVISTIHTNSAAGAIPRFLAMGVKPFLLAPALNCIIGQRLVRKICPDCRQEVKLEPEVLARVQELLKGVPPQSGNKTKTTAMRFSKGKGCDQCGGLGYRGRIGIYEIMALSQEMEQLLLAGQATEYTIRDIAVKQGMVTMVQDGLLKALDGITTVEEVFRVAE